MITRETFKKGLLVGLNTTWSLAKVIFPITLIVSVLEYTPILGWIVTIFTPLMGLIGLQGDAAVILALGNLLNLYAAIGAILTMTLTVKEVFILAVMLSFSHNLLIETAIAGKIGVKMWIMATIRLVLAFSSALIINLIWQGGQETAVYGLIPTTNGPIEGLIPIALQALKTASIGVAQIAGIVIPIMIGIQILKDINALIFFAKVLSPLTKLLGVSDKTGVTLMAGLVFGIAYGAGVMLQAAKEENLSQKDLYLVSIFLVACHAVIEDTLIFYPLGINVLPLLIMRLSLAIIITMLTAKIWPLLIKDSSFIKTLKNNSR